MGGSVAALAALCFAVACGSTEAAPSSDDGGEGARPALRVVSLSPLVVRGTRFVAGERVKLLVSAGTPRRRSARADRSGRFTAAFALELDPCTSFVVQAFGTSGSRAMVDVTAPDCSRP